MMKYVMIFAICLSAFFAAKAQKPTSIVFDDWRGYWAPVQRNVYEYNVPGKKIRDLIQRWHEVSGIWEDSLQTTYSYKPYFPDWEELTQVRDNLTASWKNIRRVDYLHNPMNFKLDLESIMAWNGNGWRDSISYSYSWGGVPLLIYKIRSDYDPQNNYWHTKAQWLYHYFNYQDSLLGYNINRWDIPTQMLTDSLRIVYTYAGRKKVATETTYRPQPSGWKPSTRILNTYVTSGLKVNTSYQYWDELNSNWVDSMQTGFIYDANSVLYQEIDQVWNPSAHIWENLERRTYGYGTTSIPFKTLVSSCRIFPNPAGQWLQIEFADAASTRLVVMDISGKLLSAQTFSGAECRLDVQQLPSGFYNLIIERNQKTEVVSFQKW